MPDRSVPCGCGASPGGSRSGYGVVGGLAVALAVH